MKTRHLFSLCTLLLLPGCVSLLRPGRISPSGIEWQEATTRGLLVNGRADSVALLIDRGTIDPGDDLLRTMYEALALHHAGQHERAVARFERAVDMTDDRVTKSVSRSLLSIVSNDRALPYVPSATERLFLPYYAALSYVRMGDMTGAAVEARRLSMALEREDPPDDLDVRRTQGVLSYFAGAIFERAGERNDAAVAYRRAIDLAPDLVSADDTLWLTDHRAAAADSGDVLVLVESGFTAPRVEAALYAWLGTDVFYTLTDGDRDGRASAALLVAAQIASSGDDRALIRHLDALEDGGPGRRSGRTSERHDDDDGDEDGAPYLLKVAWPVLRRPATAPSPTIEIRAYEDWLDGSGPGVFGSNRPAFTADLAASLAHDFRDQQTLVLARAVLRAAAKLALAKAAEKEVSEKDETAGRIIGIIANASGVLLERADTRAWSVLPSGITVRRLRLPVGRRTILVEVEGRTIERTVLVAAAVPTILDVRVW